MTEVDTQTKTYKRRWIALIFICLSLLVVSVNNNILYVALPSITQALDATTTQMQWVTDAYSLIFASVLLIFGSLSDKHGRKKFLLWGLFGMGIATYLANIVTNAGQLVVVRGLMGLTAAAIMPSTLSIISNTFTDEKERTKAIGIWAGVFGLGIAIGPLIGGALLESFEWQAVFLVNIPIIIVALLGVWIWAAESKEPTVHKTDWWGASLSAAGLLALMYGIIGSGENGWLSFQTILFLAIAALILWLFIRYEKRIENALLPMYLFANKSFSAANAALVAIMFALFGINFFLTQYTQTVLAYPPFKAGLSTLPLALTLLVVSFFSGKVVKKFNTKRTVTFALFTIGIGILYLALVLSISTPYWVILIGYLILGLGIGLAMSPATDSVMSSAPASKAGTASAMNDTTRELGGALGIAVLGSIVTGMYLDRLTQLKEQYNVPEEIYQEISEGIESAHHFANYLPVPEVQNKFLEYVNTAFVDGIVRAMYLGAILLLIMAYVIYKNLPAETKRPEN